MLSILQKITKRILPDWIYLRLTENLDKEGFKKYFTNTGWLFLGKAFSLLVSFFMVAIIARYLGPDNLGRLSYAQSFVAIFSVFASLGINNILFRDLVANPDKEREILGTAFLIKLIFGVLTTIATTLVAFFTNSDQILTLLILILSLTFIVEPFGITSTVFNARVKAKYSVFSQIIVTAIIPFLKLIVIFSGKGIIFFALIIFFEIVMNALISILFYINVFKDNPLNWRINLTYGQELIKNSAPMLFAGVSGYLFSRVDQVMLLHMLGASSVGLYQSAVQITDMLAGFIPGIIIASVVPALINAKKENPSKYFSRLRQLTVLILTVSIILITFISFFAPFIVRILYGTEFIEATSILHIYIWSSLLYMIILILQQHLINENMTGTFLFLSATTAATNILLNMILIPIYGTHGAALATLISLFIYVILPIFIKRARKDYANLIGLKS